MKNARHSNPVNQGGGEMTNCRGGYDEPKKKSHVTLFAYILWHSSVL